MKTAMMIMTMAMSCLAQKPAIVELNAANPDIPLKITPSKSKPEALKRFNSITAETQKEQDACQAQQRKVDKSRLMNSPLWLQRLRKLR